MFNCSTNHRNSQESTSHDCNTRKSILSDPSSFFEITSLLWITDIYRQSCIPSLVLSVSEICATVMWAQHETGEKNLLVSSEKTGRGDISRYSWNRWSQWVVRCDYCRYIFYNRTDNSFRLLTDIVDHLKCVTNLLTLLRTHEISGMSNSFLTLSSTVWHTQGNLSPGLSPVTLCFDVFPVTGLLDLSILLVVILLVFFFRKWFLFFQSLVSHYTDIYSYVFSLVLTLSIIINIYT